MKNSLGIYRVFLCKKCHCWHCIQNASISEPLITNKERNQTHTHKNRHTTRTTVDATRLSIVFWTVLLFMNEKTNSNYTWRSDGKSLLQTITICLKRKEATERESKKKDKQQWQRRRPVTQIIHQENGLKWFFARHLRFLKNPNTIKNTICQYFLEVNRLS